MDRWPLLQPVTVSTEVRLPPVPPATIGTLTDPGTILLRVKRPDGTFLPDYTSPVHDSTGKYHQDLPISDLTQLGPYQYEWVTGGTGAGVSPPTSFIIYDPFATPDLEAWRPTRPQVAKYIPERTLQADQTSDTPLNDFTTATTPTAAQADSHIDDAAAWLGVQTGTLDPSMYSLASAVVAIRAAGMIEISYPVRDGDINTGQALLAQADLMLARLVTANEAVTPGTAATGVLSAWMFPPAVPWGDRIEIF